MCDFPYYVRNPSAHKSSSQKLFVPVPCGKCPPCLVRRSNGWQFRLSEQERISSSAIFLTLTYDTAHVPITPKGFMTLKKRDFQAFMKRLRKLHPKNARIRYYAVGEYGSTNFRPHYHAIMFDVDISLLEKAWRDPKTGSQIGIVHHGSVSGASIAYTCKYLHKGKIIPQHQNDDRLPEFSLMSKKMGLSYMTPQMLAWHQADISRNYVVLPGGQKSALPRYFRDKIYTPEQRAIQNLKTEKGHEENLAILETDYRARSGDSSIGGFEKSDFEARKQRLEQFRERARKNRSKL